MAIYRGEGGAGDATADASNAAALADSFADAANASAGQAATSAAAALAAKTAAETAETNAETAETNAEAAEAAAVIAKDAAEAVLLDTGFSVVASDLQGDDNIGTVADDIVNVNAVATNIASVIAVDANEANINIVAADGTDIGTVATSIADVNSVADNIADVTAVADNETNIDAVAANNTNITTVAGISANVTTVAGISANVTTVATNNANVTTVATNIANVNSVGTNIANVNSVAGNATNINAVAGNSTNINTVAGISANVTTVATNNANVTTVAGSIANVNTNATNIANINQNAANIVAIQNASANATAAASSATAAAGSATSASASAAAASAVALGNEPVRHSVRPSLLLDFANTKTLDPRITFTRASTGTFYDGKTVAKAEENLLTYSQEFDNAAWLKFNTTVSANATTSPDGTTTAELAYPTSTGASRNLYRSVMTSGSQYVISVYAKAGGLNHLCFYEETGSGTGKAWFNLSTGAVGTVAGGYTASIVDAGSGWYRCIVVRTVTGAFVSFAGTDADNSSTSTTSGTNGVFLWGAQLEQRSSVTAYTATTTAPITNYIPALQTAASGVARFEHNPVTGESLGLEIEEQRTNLVTASEDANTYFSFKSNMSVSSNVAISPNGTLTADTAIPSSGSSSKIIANIGVTFSAQAHTATIFAKSNGYNWISLGFYDGAASYHSWFNLDSGTVGTSESGNTASIQAVGNGWYRCSITRTLPSTASGQYRIYVTNADNTSTFNANGFSGIHIWGAQIEAGSFATSYIPTVASQVTRSADSAVMTGTNFSSWHRTDEGTVYCDISGRGLCLGFNIASSDNPRYQVGVTNSYGFSNDSSSFSISYSNATKIGLAVKTNDVSVVRNGTVSGTDTSFTIPNNVSRLNIGFANGESYLNGTIKKIAYYPLRLTNAELQGLTTV